MNGFVCIWLTGTITLTKTFRSIPKLVYYGMDSGWVHVLSSSIFGICFYLVGGGISFCGATFEERL